MEKFIIFTMTDWASSGNDVLSRQMRCVPYNYTVNIRAEETCFEKYISKLNPWKTTYR